MFHSILTLVLCSTLVGGLVASFGTLEQGIIVGVVSGILFGIGSPWIAGGGGKYHE
jgi:hypothetical protein